VGDTGFNIIKTCEHDYCSGGSSSGWWGGARWVEGQMKERYFQVAFIPFGEGYLKA